MDTIASSLLIISSNLQVTNTAIKSRTSLYSSHIHLLLSELPALEHRKKCYGHYRAFSFDWNFKLEEDRHKSLDEFHFCPEWTIRFRVTCPWLSKIFPIDLQ